ncbi:hypothetical protein BOX15_Mlig003961g1 [Macrostomum lignano]|uniref:Uncharacterized protein n=2 Tax=Macrostomum lignano TaxID=282301 RepID=A0A267ECZ4_9PLAT|nr:hypothetical protein BOX15_Mlig003961g2 [Macrostomum lignano]PAA64847.1 hypothetical protein BOX15_Mlig003961g1 [Macrostomum lignano]
MRPPQLQNSEMPKFKENKSPHQRRDQTPNRSRSLNHRRSSRENRAPSRSPTPNGSPTQKHHPHARSRRSRSQSISQSGTEEINARDKSESEYDPELSNATRLKNQNEYKLEFFGGRYSGFWKKHYGSISKEKRRVFNESLVSLINSLRRRYGQRLRPLVLSRDLCRGAKAVWSERAQTTAGLTFTAETRYELRFTVNHSGASFDRLEIVDCLLFTDVAVRAKSDLPEAVFHYWVEGRHTDKPGKRPLPPGTNNSTVGGTARSESEKASKVRGYRQLLLMSKCRYIGLHFAKFRKHHAVHSNEPFSVVALLSEQDLMR